MDALQDLNLYKNESKDMLLANFTTFLSLKLINQFVNSTTEDIESRKNIKNQIFTEFESCMRPVSQNSFSNLNNELNTPRQRFISILEGNSISIEDYQSAFNNALREMRNEFIESYLYQ